MHIMLVETAFCASPSIIGIIKASVTVLFRVKVYEIKVSVWKGVVYELILIPLSLWTGNIRESVSSEEQLMLAFHLGTEERMISRRFLGLLSNKMNGQYVFFSALVTPM